MAYGRERPICGGIVDNNEFNYLRGMCTDCVNMKDREDIRHTELARIINAEFKQMCMEDMVVNGY